MKLFFYGLLVFTGAASAVDKKSEHDRTLYSATQMNLEFLLKQGMDGQLAVYDFYQQLKNPKHNISYPPAVKMLRQFELLELDTNDIRAAIRDAFNSQAASSDKK